MKAATRMDVGRHAGETARTYMPLLFSRGLIVVLAWAILLLPCPAWAAMRVIGEAGTNPQHQAMVQKTVDLFNGILQHDMGVTLEQDVRIFLCPTRDSYRQVLQRELGQNTEQAARNAPITAGFSSYATRAIALKMDVAASSSGMRAYKTTAHELFHQLQNQLAGMNKKRGYYWLSEGTADLIGSTVAERVGYQSLDKWSLDQLNTLRNSPTHVSPQAILNITLDQWTTFLEAKQRPYEVADLMVLYLLRQTGPGGYRAIADYYRFLGLGLNNEQAFFQAFGINPAQLIAGFQVWYDRQAASPATVEMLSFGTVPLGLAQDGELAVALTRRFLQEHWRQDLISSLRLIFTADKPGYAAAMVREFGVTPAEAEQNAKSTVWRYSGGTMLFDMGSLPTKADRLYAVSNAVLKKYFGDRIPATTGTPERLPWMKRGLADATAVMIVAQSGARTADSYRSVWLNTLSRVGAYPSLAELRDAADWDRAPQRYGVVARDRVAGLAGLYLTEKYGVDAINQWCEAARAIGPDAAFSQVFRTSLQEFEDEFSRYLVQYAKKNAG